MSDTMTTTEPYPRRRDYRTLTEYRAALRNYYAANDIPEVTPPLSIWAALGVERRDV